MNVSTTENWLMTNLHYFTGTIAVLYGLFFKDPQIMVVGFVALGLGASNASKIAAIAGSMETMFGSGQVGQAVKAPENQNNAH